MPLETSVVGRGCWRELGCRTCRDRGFRWGLPDHVVVPEFTGTDQSLGSRQEEEEEAHWFSHGDGEVVSHWPT